jgi:16S rRNA processing protein RimM
VAVGRITRAHGVGGEVAVMPLTEIPERFEPGSNLVLGEDPEDVLRVAAARPHRDRLLVTFEGVQDRTAAERLAGRYVFVASSASPELPEGEFWSHDLIGADVLTESGRSLGALREVIHTQANDVWIAVAGDGTETLVPALHNVVASVDVTGRRVIVRDVPGITAPEE